MDHFGITKVLNTFNNGAQKIVYIVIDSKGDTLAMKCFRNCSQRDIQEIAILEKFRHIEGISRVKRVEDYHGSPVMFEEFIDAPNLEDIVASYAGDASKIAALISGLAETLRPIWEDRIVHRDLKPNNIKILPNGKSVILDFGIARDLAATESITETGDVQPMTWNYASPEQYRKDKDSISYRTDFFVLGVIGYVLYYQRHPFGENPDEVAVKYSSADNTILSDDNCKLNPFFEASMAFDPSMRPRNVDTFIATLYTYL